MRADVILDVIWQAQIHGAAPEYACGATWCDFLPELSLAIERAWSLGENLRWTEPDSVSGSPYDINPREGFQRNERSGVCRAIRRVLVESADSARS